MNNPGKAERSSFTNHPLQTPNMHTQNLREKKRAHKGLGETKVGDMEQQTRLRTFLTFPTLEDV